MDQPMLTANPELTIDEASVLVGLAHRDGHTEIATKLRGAIMDSTDPLSGVKAIELNRPTITSAPSYAIPLASLGTLAIDAVDETAGIGGTLTSRVEGLKAADSEGGEA